MKLNPLIFRAYDIRGVVDKDINQDFAYLLGRAFADLISSKQRDNIAIGFDCRHSSAGYAEALAQGISAEGLHCCMLGLGPTPQLYWALHQHEFGGGIQVTGSHNPADMNGFKLCLGTQTLSGADIQALRERMIAMQQRPAPENNPGSRSELSLQEEYCADLIENCKAHMGARKLKVVVDAGNGVAGLSGPAVLRGIGVEVIELYCEPDGSFPNHHPDPTDPPNMADLSAKVRACGADFGIGWDGDGDRIGLVDEQGSVIYSDMLLLIYARDLLRQQPGATILADVKCSTRLFDDVHARGGKAVMWKTGHSLLKKKLREINGHLGGELAGHIFFVQRFYGFDDGIYCAARLAEIVSNIAGPIATLLSDLPTMLATPEIKVACAEEQKFKVAEQAQSLFPEYATECIDGVRITFEHGWGLIRASNTGAVLILRFEAENQQYLQDYQQIVHERLAGLMQKI